MDSRTKTIKDCRMNRQLRLLLGLFGLIGLLLLSAFPVLAQDSADGPVYLLKAEGSLTPAMSGYIERGLQVAARENATAVILQLNTPGGGEDLMNKIIEDLRGSSVPVIVYVAPNGAMAGSAGTLITLAGHLAAMAPETAIGAASPIQASGEDIPSTLESKIKNIFKATARSLAERRGPEAVKLAEDTIENATAVSATEALKAGLIDYIATDVNDVLRQADGATVIVNEQEQTLHTAFKDVIPLDSTFIEQVLHLLTNANLVLVLLNLGVLAILFELSSPGGWVSGFIGVVCLALAVYGLGLLPVNWFGAIFLVLSFVLFILDIKAPTHGALTIAGAASFVVGALVLFNSPNVPPVQRVSVPLVFAMGAFTALFFLVLLTFALRAQRVPILTGRESVAGRVGFARSDINPHGTVQVGGEQWTAELADPGEPIRAGSRVEVVSVKGLRLKVRQTDAPPSD